MGTCEAMQEPIAKQASLADRITDKAVELVGVAREVCDRNQSVAVRLIGKNFPGECPTTAEAPAETEGVLGAILRDLDRVNELLVNALSALDGL